MSYDTYIMIDTGGNDLAEVVDVGNMTSNIGGMYYKAMPGPYPGGGRYWGMGPPEDDRGGLPGLSGLKCEAAAEIIESGLVYMQVHEDEMRKMEPDNGWGGYDGAVRHLTKILMACRLHPKATLAVSW